MRTRMAALAVGAALLPTACGSGTSAVRVVGGSVTRTSSAGTAHVSSFVRIAAASGPLSTGRSIQSDGAVDFTTRQATFRVTTETSNIDAVIDGTVVYEHIPQIASAVGGRTWLRIDLKTAGQLAEVPGLSTVFQAQPSDPAQVLDYLRGVSGRITTAGRSTVRGVATTRYRLTVDLNQAAASLSPDQQAALRQLIDRLGLKPTLPVEVWIDAQDRVRRLHLVLDYSQGNPPPGVARASLPSSVDETLELYDFGAPVTVQAPPADQVADITQLVKPASK